MAYTPTPKLNIVSSVLQCIYPRSA